MKSYLITSPHYLRQAGQSEPEYVAASPENPVRVTLDDDMEPGYSQTVDKDGKPTGPKVLAKGWHAVEAPPAKPKPAHAPANVAGVPKAPEANKVKGEGRAADR